MEIICSVNSLDIGESLDMGLYQEDFKQMQQNCRILCTMCTGGKLSPSFWLGWRRGAAGAGTQPLLPAGDAAAAGL